MVRVPKTRFVAIACDASSAASVVDHLRYTVHAPALDGGALSGAQANVRETLSKLRSASSILSGLEGEKKVALIGAMYDVATGQVEFLGDEATDEYCMEVAPPR